MAGLHCADCIFSNIEKSDKNGEYFGTCAKGYTLTNRHPDECELPNFALEPSSLYPSVDPYGKLFLGTSWVCPSFNNRGDAGRKPEKPRKKRWGRGSRS